MINILGLQFHIYGLLIGVAVWAAWEVALRVASEKKVPTKFIDCAAWFLIIGGVIGARLYHVIDLWQRYYWYQPIKVFFVWEGGLAIWGAIIGGMVGLFIYFLKQKSGKKTKYLQILELLDIVVVGMPLAQAIGRLGNWVNNELYGKNGEPLFAYEATANLLLFLILWKLSARKTPLGTIAGVYFVGYGIVRMILENLRPNEIIWSVEGLPVAVIFGMISVLFGTFLILRKRAKII